MPAEFLPLGEPVLYYNRWTGWDNRDVLKFFRRLTDEEIGKLRLSDRIWVSEDPIHPNGKVYGFVGYQLVGMDAKGYILLKGGGSSAKMSLRFASGRIYVVDEEKALAEFIAANPLSTDVIGDSGRMATALLEGLGTTLSTITPN